MPHDGHNTLPSGPSGPPAGDTPPPAASRWPAVVLWALPGIVFALVAWALPVHIKSVTPALLRQAGEGTLAASALGQRLLDGNRPGPAAIVLDAARALGDPHAGALEEDLAAFARRQPALIPWGGRDPFLDPLMKQPGVATRAAASTPVLTFFVPERARAALRDFLANSRSPGVLALLSTRGITATENFVPATRAGGQTLDATLLLAALLYQGEHLTPALQRELATLAADANASGRMGPLEDVYLNLLSLGRRLDWMQLASLLRITGSVETLAQFAGLSRAVPDAFPLLYTAALLDGSADPVAGYFTRHGAEAALPDLRLALGFGEGAVRQLLLRQVPVSRQAAPPAALGVGQLAEVALLYPRAVLAAKYVAWFLAAFCLLRALDRAIVGRATRPRSGFRVQGSELSATGSSTHSASLADNPKLQTLNSKLTRDSVARPHLVSAVLAILLGGLVIAATEPFLLRVTPAATDFRLSFAVPVISDVTDSSTLTHQPPSFAMDTNSLLSIGLFAALQIGMYLICLLKIQSIDRLPLGPLVKLRLMENEENLFDGGLYLGIAGTAAALVLQVLGVLDPNLLAAYSSNLFGITCVALVKIRHVRPYKNKLILEGQAAIAAAAAGQLSGAATAAAAGSRAPL
ncbi:hypothetical protein OPIT5_15510 [Opitutaceae bacterium TAV5]|nr:hypothetical protein OPIT5_15510 [Opitutaceae bacterium TAV5]